MNFATTFTRFGDLIHSSSTLKAFVPNQKFSMFFRDLADLGDGRMGVFAAQRPKGIAVPANNLTGLNVPESQTRWVYLDEIF